MSIFDWRKRRPADGRIESLELQVEQLQHKLDDLKQELEKAGKGTVQIGSIQIDKVVIEQVRHHNEIGGLEVTDLSGTLNIGATYTGPIPESFFEQVLHGKMPASKPGPSADQDGAKPDRVPLCRMRPRSDNASKAPGTGHS